MSIKYKLSEDIFVRIDMNTAFVYDGLKKQIYKIPIILGLILDAVRVEARTTDEIQNDLLVPFANDPDIQMHKEKVKACVSNLVDKNLIIIEKDN